MADEDTLAIEFGREELDIRNRYEVLSILNDFVIGLWFVAGSVLFFSGSTSTVGIWMFLLGSLQMLIRPGIRLARRVQLHRVSPEHPTDTGFDH